MWTALQWMFFTTRRCWFWSDWSSFRGEMCFLTSGHRDRRLFFFNTVWTGTEVMRSSNRAAERLCPDAVAPGEVWEKIGFPDIYVYIRQGFTPRSRCRGSNKTVHTMAGKLIFFFLAPKETVTFEECYKLKCQKLSQSWGKKKERCWITHSK